MTKEEFLEKAREKHGYKYNYPKLKNKVLSNDNIEIEYDGVVYTQKVVKHILLGRCPEKNTLLKTTDSFIKESKLIHGDKYDYSLVDYKGSLSHVKIIYEGIIFDQIASSHIKGYSPELKYNRDFFIKKSIDKWGDKYDYSLIGENTINGKVKIIHKETGIIYYQSTHGHLKCAPEKIQRRSNTEEFIKKSNKVHDFKYDYSLVNYTISSNKVKIICNKHGEFLQVANSHIMGLGCKKCGDEIGLEKRDYTTKYSTDEFISESKSIWGNKYDYSLVKYVNARTKVKIIYDGIIYEQLPMGHFKYPVEGFLDNNIFLIKAKRKWGDKYDYSLVEFMSTKIPVKIVYNNIIYEQLPHNHLIYAPELRNKVTQEEFISKAEIIHNKKYNYNLVKYVNDRKRVIIICKHHGEFLQTPNVHLRGSGCKKCNESFGEKEISNFLNNNSILYEREHKFNNCRNIYPLRFDFYIPSIRTCIEFDGIQHFQPVGHFGGLKAYESLKINDKIKNDYCEDNYINIIRIRYDQIDDIYQILWNNLKS